MDSLLSDSSFQVAPWFIARMRKSDIRRTGWVSGAAIAGVWNRIDTRKKDNRSGSPVKRCISRMDAPVRHGRLKSIRIPGGHDGKKSLAFVNCG